MNRVILPKKYVEKLDIYQTQLAIGMLRQFFQQRLCQKLNLKRVTAPLFVQPETGLNDDLLQKYIADSSALWEGNVDELPISLVGSVVGTHAGPGAVAVAYFRK